MTRILGLDPAGKFGWVLLEDNTYLDGGAKPFKHPTKKQIETGKKLRSQKWIDVRDWMSEIVSETEPDLIFFEWIENHVSTLAGHSYGYLKYTLQTVCDLKNKPLFPVRVQHWKISLTGKGNASKEDVSMAANGLYPDITFESDDHSDALGIALHGLKMFQTDQLDTLWSNTGGKKKK